MTNKQALRVPERKKHNWGQAVMRDCDFCQQWALTVNHNDGGSICASCCDSEYTSSLSSSLVVAIERAEAAEKRIAELEAREVVLPQRISMEGGSYCTAHARYDEEGDFYYRDEVIESLVAAGIRINGEG